MKKLLLSVSLLALLAAPSFAYVQSGQLTDNGQNAKGQNGAAKMQRWMEVSPPTAGPTTGPSVPNPTVEPVFEPLVEGVTRPIPEPGTMILASLGLLALGASRARRRGR